MHRVLATFLEDTNRSFVSPGCKVTWISRITPRPINFLLVCKSENGSHFRGRHVVGILVDGSLVGECDFRDVDVL